MKRQRVLRILLILLLAGIILPGYSYGEILFEDNFDNSPDWQSQQTVWKGAGGTDISFGHTYEKKCTTYCPPQGWTAYRAASSHWSDDRGQDTYILDTVGARGGHGKGITYWLEGSDWSGGSLNKWLGTEGYEELYVRYYLKYPEEWQWRKPDYSATGIQKLMRISSFPDIDMAGLNPFLFLGLTGANNPVFYPDWVYRPKPVDWAQFSAIGTIGPDFDQFDHHQFNDVRLPNDYQWHCYEFYVKMNSSPGIADGMYRFYIDGNLQVEMQGILWRKGWKANYDYSLGTVNKFNYQIYPTNFGQGYYYEVIADNGVSGQTEPAWPETPSIGVTEVADGGLIWRCAGKSAPGWNWLFFLDNVYLGSFKLDDRVEMPMYMDDVVVSTEYIGPDYVIGGRSCDINGDGEVNVQDVQICVNVILGLETREEFVNKVRVLTAPEAECTVADLQRIVNVILGV